jgi:WD40 repeat protein
MRWRVSSICLVAFIALSGCQSTVTVSSSPIPEKLSTAPAQGPTDQPNATITEVQAVTPAATLTGTATGLPPTPTPPAAALPVPAVLITSENATRLEEVGRMDGSSYEMINALAWSPDGELLAASAGDQILLLKVDGARLDPIVALPMDALVPALAFSPDGAWLASGARDGIVRVWKVQPLTQAGNPDLSPSPAWQAEGHQKGVNTLDYSADGRILASGGNDAVARLWNPVTGEPLGMIIGGSFAVPSIAFSPDGNSLAIANGEYIRLRDPNSESITGTLLSETPIYTLEYSPDGSRLAAGDISNGVQIWDPSQAFRTGLEVYPTPLKLTGHTARPTSFRALIWDVAYSNDGTLLASAGGDNTIRMWDATSGTLLATLMGHQDAVTSLAYSPDGTRLVSGGLDGKLIIWEVK